LSPVSRSLSPISALSSPSLSLGQPDGLGWGGRSPRPCRPQPQLISGHLTLPVHPGKVLKVLLCGLSPAACSCSTSPHAASPPRVSQRPQATPRVSAVSPWAAHPHGHPPCERVKSHCSARVAPSRAEPAKDGKGDSKETSLWCHGAGEVATPCPPEVAIGTPGGGTSPALHAARGGRPCRALAGSGVPGVRRRRPLESGEGPQRCRGDQGVCCMRGCWDGSARRRGGSGDGTRVHACLAGGRKDGARLFPAVGSAETRGNDLKLKHGKIHRNFFPKFTVYFFF